MEKYLANSYKVYFNKLRTIGYIDKDSKQALMIMTFLYRLIYKDYRGKIKKGDFHIIEKAINCLYNSTCLLPYREYNNMGKLHIGEYTELNYLLCQMADDIHKGINDRLDTLEDFSKDVESKIEDAVEAITKVDEMQNTVNNLSNTVEFVNNNITSINTDINTVKQNVTNVTNDVGIIKTTNVIKKLKDGVYIADISI